MEQRCRPVIHSETVYILANILLAFAVAMVTAAGFGVSMIVAPAYIFSQKFTLFTFGQSEYIVQSFVFAAMCIALRKFRFVYFTSYLTCLFYGAILDLWRLIIPIFNESVTPAGSLPMPARIALFTGGMLLTGFSVALFFRTYFCPQVYDFAVKTVSDHFHIERTRFKRIFDACCLAAALIMVVCFFFPELRGLTAKSFLAEGFHGIGIGTFIMTVLNGVFIHLWGKFFDRIFEVKPFLPKVAAYFEK